MPDVEQLFTRKNILTANCTYLRNMNIPTLPEGHII